MDEFKTDDGFRPDAGDRYPPRSPHGRHRAVKEPMNFSLSRRNLTIVVGMLVLIFLLFGIGSALKKTPATTAVPEGGKEINLAPMPNTNAPAPTSNQPQQIQGSAISSIPTQAAVLPANQAQTRLELPGDLVDSLNQHSNQINSAAQGAGASLPTAPAKLAPKPLMAVPALKPVKVVEHSERKGTTSVPSKQNAVSATASSTKKILPNKPTTGSLPTGHYTIQVSASSKAETLKVFAQKQALSPNWVYETRRDGKPWYVLVSGNYSTSTEAKAAIATLPVEVQTAKPWVKSVHQIRQELKQN